MATLYFLSTLVLTIVVSVPINVLGSAYCGPVEANDQDLIQFPLNLEFLEAEFFLNGALGHGLDAFEPGFAAGGPPDRAIITTVGGVPRPLYDLSPEDTLAPFHTWPTPPSRSLVASLLGVDSGQDAVIRTLLYEKAYEKVLPYNINCGLEFTNAIS
ncbi:desiccation-related protein PCC13-62-like [Populus alba x Populus x berolinensis]|nr:desiccation-related protein PCC13-62-like [Populus alba x Populus x berolinensis]